MRQFFVTKLFDVLQISILVLLGGQSNSWAAFIDPTASVERTLYAGPGSSHSTGGIFRIDFATPNIAEEIVPVEFVNTSTGIAVDSLNRKLYWVADTQSLSTDKIFRSDLDGSNVELFLTPPGQPAGIKIDSANNKMYWSERFTASINVIDLDGSDQQQIISTSEPRGLYLDTDNEHLYWVEFIDNKLKRAKTNGSSVEEVITSGMSRPFDVAVDSINERLYWVELGPSNNNDEGKVWTANLDGSSPILIADNQYQPTDIAVDLTSESVYWGANGNLLRADLDGSNVSIASSAGAGYVNFAFDIVFIPEPATSGLVMIAIFCWIAGRRRLIGSSSIHRG